MSKFTVVESGFSVLYRGNNQFQVSTMKQLIQTDSRPDAVSTIIDTLTDLVVNSEDNLTIMAFDGADADDSVVIAQFDEDHPDSNLDGIRDALLANLNHVQIDDGYDKRYMAILQP